MHRLVYWAPYPGLVYRCLIIQGWHIASSVVADGQVYVCLVKYEDIPCELVVYPKEPMSPS